MNALETHAFSTDGVFPNARLPLLVDRAALAADAEAMIRPFAASGWSNAWIDGIVLCHPLERRTASRTRSDALTPCWRISFSENRCALFGPML